MAGTINQGYLRIKYKYEFIFAHRIIWAKFGDTPLDSILVLNHKDGNKLNNEISNLEQISQKANNQHKKDILNSKPNFDKKLTQEIADQIRLDYESGCSQLNLTKKYTVSRSLIHLVVRNKAWVAVAQLVEPRIVIPVVAGSSPVGHPIILILLRFLW